MGAELIPLLQMAIWLIVAIMIGFVALYVYLMRPRNNNTSINDKFNQEYNNKNQYDDGINNNYEDEGPITRL